MANLRMLLKSNYLPPREFYIVLAGLLFFLVVQDWLSSQIKSLWW